MKITFWHDFDQLDLPDEDEQPLPPQDHCIDGIYAVPRGRKLPVYETEKPVLHIRP